MSNPPIPDRNLPIYLQKYDIDIVNVAFPGCQLSERGCCSDKVTPVPPDGQCPIGGCAGTEFGCCPYDTTPKSDPEGSNCQNIAGKVLYSTVGAITSNKADARVWQLNLSGVLKPNAQVYYFVYDFTKVDFQGDIKFEGALSGTVNVCGQVLDATKVIGKNYYFSDVSRTLTIYIKITKLGFRLKKESKFSYQVQINDSCSNGCAGKTSCDEIFFQASCSTTCPSTDKIDVDCGKDAPPLPPGVKNSQPIVDGTCLCCYNEKTKILSCTCKKQPCGDVVNGSLTNITPNSTIYFCDGLNSYISTTPCPT